MPNGELVVEVDDLRMRYGNTEVLQGVHLHIAAGEIVGLLGPNGAGKTTTLEILEGFRRRSSGRVRVLGQDPDRADEHWRARLGIVLQNWRDHRRWRVRELLHHLGRYYRSYNTNVRPRPAEADTLLEQLGLTAQAHTKVAQLSGGQRRRLDVAIGLIGNPELLFLDEPTVGFDPEARHDFHSLIRHIAASTTTAIILTTHDLTEAEILASRIAILANGRIVTDGSPVQLKSELAQHVVVSYMLGGHEHRTEVPPHRAEDMIRDLLNTNPEATQLEVTRPSLEHAYLNLIRDSEPKEPNLHIEGTRTMS